MSEPLVSVVIPYSSEHTPEQYLHQAKESVESQSVRTEILVVEDTEQKGPAWARNRGLERAETRYVALLDADDRWKDNKLSAQIQQLRETGAGICVEGEYDDQERFMGDLFLMRTMSLTSSIFIDTERTNVRFEESLERREDHLFILEATLQAGICFVSDIVETRKHEGGLSSRNTPALRIEQNKQFIEFVSTRIDEELVEKNQTELFRHLYHRIGRSKHYQGEYKSASQYLYRSLKKGISVKTTGALAVSIVWYSYSLLISFIEKWKANSKATNE